MQHTRYAIIVPAFNPARGWSQQLLLYYQELKTVLPSGSYTLILVNDGSSTNSFETEAPLVLKQEPATIILQHQINRGKGASLRLGVATAQADYYLVTDIDFPYTTSSMQAILNKLEHTPDADITLGNRSAAYYKKVPGFRAFLSRFLRYLIRKRLHLPFDDTQCGVKAMNKKGKEIFLSTKINRYLYDLEFVVKAAASQNLRILPVSVELRPGIFMRRMSPRILLQEGINFIKIILFRHRL